MPRPINMCRIRRSDERPVWIRRDWRWSPWSQFLWVWLDYCPSGYDRHKTWRIA